MVGIPLLDNRDLLISNASGFGESSALGDGSADSSVGAVGEGNRLPLFGDDSGGGTDPSCLDGNMKDHGE